MLVTFKSETFSWLKENCNDKSVAAFIVAIVEDRINNPQIGVKNEQENTSSTE